MKNALIFICLAVATSSVNSQNAAIDSLSTLIRKEKSDEKRIELKIQLVREFGQVNLDSALNMGEKVREEAKKLNYKIGEADALRAITSNLLRAGHFQEAKSKLKEAEAILRSLKDTTKLGKIYSAYGMMYGMQSQYDSSRFYFQKAIDISLRTGNKKDLGGDYGGLAISYQMQSNYPQALLYQQKSLKIAEEQNDISAQAYTSLNMGSTYQKFNDTIRAEAMLLKAVELAKKKGLKIVEVYAYTNLSGLYMETRNWEKSYAYAIKAALLANEFGDVPIEAASYSKAATALAHLNRFAEAELLINKQIKNTQVSEQPIILSQLNEAMGNTLKLQGKFKEAIPYYKRNIKILQDMGNYDMMLGGVYWKLSECYQETGDYKNALLDFKEYASIRDSIRSGEKIKEITEQTMNYEFEKKEELQRLEQKNRDEIYRTRQIALIIGLVLTLILVFVAYRALRIKQKGNAKLREQKENIQKALAKLKRTQAQLIQAEKMASLGELTAGIAHEIQNPLNFVNNFSEVSNELIVEMNEELEKGNYGEAQEIAQDLKTNLEKINHHGKRADAIVKGMLQHSRKSSAEKEPTDINVLCDEYLRLSYHGLRAKDKSFNVSLETEFDSSIGRIDLNPQNMGRVLLNIINNAFYALNEKQKRVGETFKPKLLIQTKGEANGISIIIKDNGDGIPESVLAKIFQPFFTTKPSGQGTGLGLSISYDIVTKGHGGKLKVETEEGEGTTFMITIPKTVK